MAEKILIHYGHAVVYTSSSSNAVGTTTSTTLRTVTAHDDTVAKYVRKFGKPYTIKEVTAAAVDTPRGSGSHSWSYKFYGVASDGTETLLGTLEDDGTPAFTQGSTLSTACAYVRIDLVGGTGNISITNNDTLTITTDLDTDLSVVLSGESYTAPGSVTVMPWYLSQTGSTYYDQDMTVGGARHTPDGTQALPYFTINAALATLGGAFTICAILDSEDYDEVITLGTDTWEIQAVLGQTPRHCPGIGARSSRHMTHDGNNSDTIYVGASGSDSTGNGKYQTPYATPYAGVNAAGTKNYVVVIDSNTYSGTAVVSSTRTRTLETAWKKTPKIVRGASSVQVTGFNDFGLSMYGFEIDCLGTGYGFYGGYAHTWTGEFSDNTVYNAQNGVYLAYGTGDFYGNGGDVRRNKIYSCSKGIEIYISNLTAPHTYSGDISYNKIYGCGLNGIQVQVFDSVATTSVIDYDIVHNQISACGGNGIYFVYTATIIYNNVTWQIVLDHNSVYKCKWGLTVNLPQNPSPPPTGPTDNNVYRSNIFYGSSLYDVVSATATTHTYSTIVTEFGSTTLSTGCTTTPPVFCFSGTTPYRLGLATTSTAQRRTADDSDDMGANLYAIRLEASTIKLNGIEFYGWEGYMQAIYCPTVQTELSMKWCNVKRYEGIGVECYSETATETDWVILNCLIYRNGEGVSVSTLASFNSITYSVLALNYKYGAALMTDDQTFTHNTVYNNFDVGLYLGSGVSGSITLQDGIYNENTNYGIFAANADMASIFLQYVAITDAVSDTIDKTGTTVIFVDPLFISTEDGSEDFRLKRIADGYVYDSGCLGFASDGTDLGAWQTTTATSEESWKKYELPLLPGTLQYNNGLTDYSEVRDALGGIDNIATGRKKRFSFAYPPNAYTTGPLRKKLEYFSGLVKTRENNLVDDDTLFLLHLKPDTFMDSGTGATVNGTLKTIMDSGKDWVEDEHKGWWACVKVLESTDLVIDATAKTGTRSVASWTTDQWAGYIIYIRGYYYRIVSNTGTVLTISDPNDTLTSETLATWALEKHFKILSNTETALTVEDLDAELPTGTYSYYIDYIKVRVVNPSFGWTMNNYIWDATREYRKAGFGIDFEEV